MSKYNIEQVVNKSQIADFHKLARRIYESDPKWICPLKDDIESRFDPVRNELLQDGEVIRWIVRDSSGTVVGRIAAFYNRALAAVNPQPTGGCGYFESIDDTEVSTLMFDTAKKWLTDRGMEAMDGPINFGDRAYWWGLLVEGDDVPLYMNNYNPPYYKNLFESYGFQNYFNQYTYLRELISGGLNPATIEKAERLYATAGYKFECANSKPMMAYADDFREVYNKAWAKFNGVNPIDEEHAHALMKTLRSIVDIKLMYFAYFENQPIGFFVMVPDLNRIIGRFNGKFGLIQKLRLMYELKVKKSCNRAQGMIFGVIPEFQGRGVEAGLIRMFEIVLEKSKLPYKTMEMSWVGDFNPVMMRFVENHVCSSKYKIHVTYRYLFDREKEFARSPKMGRTKA